MINETLSLDQALELLNSLVKIDPEGMTKLIECRIPCNSELADHPTVQVVSNEDGSDAKFGVLGLLNGLFGTYDEDPKKGWGPITAVFDEYKLVEFRRTK